MMRSGVAVVLLPPCRLGLGRIRQAQFKDTQFQAFRLSKLWLLFWRRDEIGTGLKNAKWPSTIFNRRW